MKIGFEIERISDDPSGPRTYQVRLCEALLECNENVNLVCFQLSKSDHEIFGHPRVKRLVVPSLPGLLERHLDSLELDVLHLGAGLHRYPFLSQIDTPTAATIHGIEPLVLDNHEAPLRVQIQKKYVWPWISQSLDRVITVSKTAKQQLIDHYPVYSDQVKVVYNGIDHDRFEPKSSSRIESVMKEHGIELPYFLTVSGYGERKNPETLLSAFEIAANNLSDHSLIIAGPGWENDQMDKLILNCEHGDRIHRLGTVSLKTLPGLYSGATGLIAPTRHETFGLTLLEAMACGTPVVASDVYAVPEATGDAAILIDNSDDARGFASSMQQLATDQNLHSMYRSRGLQQASKFTWKNCAQETLDLYRNIYESNEL